MLKNPHAYVREVGEECMERKQEMRKEPEKDYSLF
jgi:hypothetical protein